jgi:hypothetical protein
LAGHLSLKKRELKIVEVLLKGLPYQCNNLKKIQQMAKDYFKYEDRTLVLVGD